MTTYELNLIGAGSMAAAYAKILQDKNVNFNVIGRGKKSAAQFKLKTGVTPAIGGVEKFIQQHPEQLTSTAIVALPIPELAKSCISLIRAGITKILIEKPGAINITELNHLAEFSKQHDAEIYIAFNRRFFSSVLEIERRVKEDDGITSFNFEFTEWGKVIENTSHPNSVKDNWFFANSIHVVDLAFYLGKNPIKLYAETAGALNWHDRASRFCGAGLSGSGATFSYHANWDAPGRWGVEILTQKHRYILQPLEKLQIQKINALDVTYEDIDDHLDIEYKPGLYRMVETFLADTPHDRLPSILEHLEKSKTIYSIILPERIDSCQESRYFDSLEKESNA